MTTSDIARLEHAGRSAMAYVPEASEDRRRVSLLVGAIVPGLALLALAATLLAAVL